MMKYAVPLVVALVATALYNVAKRYLSFLP